MSSNKPFRAYLSKLRTDCTVDKALIIKLDY